MQKGEIVTIANHGDAEILEIVETTNNKQVARVRLPNGLEINYTKGEYLGKDGQPDDGIEEKLERGEKIVKRRKAGRPKKSESQKV